MGFIFKNFNVNVNRSTMKENVVPYSKSITISLATKLIFLGSLWKSEWCLNTDSGQSGSSSSDISDRIYLYSICCYKTLSDLCCHTEKSALREDKTTNTWTLFFFSHSRLFNDRSTYTVHLQILHYVMSTAEHTLTDSLFIGAVGELFSPIQTNWKDIFTIIYPAQNVWTKTGNCLTLHHSSSFRIKEGVLWWDFYLRGM